MHRDVLAALLLVWAGLVGGVSFLATPAKFRSRQLSRAVALDVGRCTFAVLGRVELAFAVAIAAAAALSPLLSPGLRIAVQAPAVILIAQLLWVRPRLDRRTQRIISGDDPPPSPLHVAFIGSETLKLCLLVALAALTR